MKLDISEQIDAPSGTTITIRAGNTVTIQGPKGDVTRQFFDPHIHISTNSASPNKLQLNALRGTRREKKRLHTYCAHLKNMIAGVHQPHEYRLKICSGHFPMNIHSTSAQFSVKNFLGEKIPRTLAIPAGVTINVEGDIIIVTSPNLELAGQTASCLEHLTRITNKDPRVFQDGIYITTKPE